MQKYATRHAIDVQENKNDPRDWCAREPCRMMREYNEWARECEWDCIVQALDRWVILKSKNEADRPGRDC